MRKVIKPGLAVCTLAISLIGCSAQSVNTHTKHHIDGQAFSGNLQHISGTLVDEDGATPIMGATVYIPKTGALPQGPIADHSLGSIAKRGFGCAKPSEPYISYSCTNGMGQFTLWVSDLSGFPLDIKFTHENNTASTNVSLNDMGEDIGTISLAQSAPKKERIAIVIDVFSPFEEMGNSISNAISMQMVEAQFEQQFEEMYPSENGEDYDVEFLALESLFEDKDHNDQLDIFGFDIVYLISRDDEELSSLSKDSKRVLLEFVSKGGELFVTTLTVESEEDTPLDQFI
jgi:hypothetical protein